MKRSILLTLTTLLTSGCVSSPDQVIAPVQFRLGREIHWTGRALMGEETYYFAPGIYTSNQRDDEGYYLVPPGGKFTSKFKNGKTAEIAGGVYLPDNSEEGICLFMYDMGFTTSANGIIMSKPPSDKMIRLRFRGPGELVSEFEKID